MNIVSSKLASSVFISHAREDRDFASQLARDLQERGFEVHHPEQHLHPGLHWLSAIEEAIQNTENVLVILSSNSGRSEWVRLETAIALSRTDKLVVPVFSTKDADVPFMLKGIQGVDLSEPNRYLLSINELELQLRKQDNPQASTIEHGNASRDFKAQLEALSLEQEKRTLEHSERARTRALAMSCSVVTVMCFLIAFFVLTVHEIDQIALQMAAFVGIASGLAGSFVSFWIIRRRSNTNTHE